MNRIVKCDGDRCDKSPQDRCPFVEFHNLGKTAYCSLYKTDLQEVNEDGHHILRCTDCVREYTGQDKGE